MSERSITWHKVGGNRWRVVFDEGQLVSPLYALAAQATYNQQIYAALRLQAAQAAYQAGFEPPRAGLSSGLMGAIGGAFGA